MSHNNILITLPDYLAQWLREEFTEPGTDRVHFPRLSMENLIFERFLKKRPKGYMEKPVDNGIKIKIPTFQGKNEDSYCYMSPAAERALVGAIKRRFKLLLRTELDGFDPRQVQIFDLIVAFCERHGIEADEKNWETVRQMYYRMRKADTAAALKKNNPDNE